MLFPSRPFNELAYVEQLKRLEPPRIVVFEGFHRISRTRIRSIKFNSLIITQKWYSSTSKVMQTIWQNSGSITLHVQMSVMDVRSATWPRWRNNMTTNEAMLVDITVHQTSRFSSRRLRNFILVPDTFLIYSCSICRVHCRKASIKTGIAPKQTQIGFEGLE